VLRLGIRQSTLAVTVDGGFTINELEAHSLQQSYGPGILKMIPAEPAAAFVHIWPSRRLLPSAEWLSSAAFHIRTWRLRCAGA